MEDAKPNFDEQLERCKAKFPIKKREFTNKKGEKDTFYILDDKDMNYVIDINNNLCDYLNNPNEDNKNKLFAILYSLMLYRCGTRWKIILDKRSIDHPRLGKVYVQNLQVLESIFYTRSKWFIQESLTPVEAFSGMAITQARLLRLNSHYIDPIPSKLFFEFILFVVKNVKDLFQKKHFFSVFLLGNLARRSDQDAILNIAFELDSFSRISRESDVREVIISIQDVYVECGLTFIGNLSLSHLVGQICENIIEKQGIPSPSSSRSPSPSSSPSPSPSLEMRSEAEQIILDKTISPSKSFELKPIPETARAREPYGGSKRCKSKYTHYKDKRLFRHNTCSKRSSTHRRRPSTKRHSTKRRRRH